MIAIFCVINKSQNLKNYNQDFILTIPRNRPSHRPWSNHFTLLLLKLLGVRHSRLSLKNNFQSQIDPRSGKLYKTKPIIWTDMMASMAALVVPAILQCLCSIKKPTKTKHTPHRSPLLLALHFNLYIGLLQEFSLPYISPRLKQAYAKSKN